MFKYQEAYNSFDKVISMQPQNAYVRSIETSLTAYNYYTLDWFFYKRRTISVGRRDSTWITPSAFRTSTRPCRLTRTYSRLSWHELASMASRADTQRLFWTATRRLSWVPNRWEATCTVAPWSACRMRTDMLLRIWRRLSIWTRRVRSPTSTGPYATRRASSTRTRSRIIVLCLCLESILNSRY